MARVVARSARHRHDSESAAADCEVSSTAVAHGADWLLFVLSALAGVATLHIRAQNRTAHPRYSQVPLGAESCDDRAVQSPQLWAGPVTSSLVLLWACERQAGAELIGVDIWCHVWLRWCSQEAVTDVSTAALL